MTGAHKTISVKLMGDDAPALLACIEHLRPSLDPGIVVTSGIKASDHREQTERRFAYDYYAYFLMSFELDPNGRVKPTHRAALELFRPERRANT
jgi:hypothetical protein